MHSGALIKNKVRIPGKSFGQNRASIMYSVPKKDLFQARGIITVLNTPFDENDKVDFAALSRNVEEALRAGVAGFLVPAMASEVHKLTLDERLDMVRVVLDTVKGKCPVFVGTAAGSLDESKKLINAHLSQECTHFLVQLPFQSRDRFISNFLELSHCGPEVIMLQDWDANGYGLPDELIVELFDEVPCFRCLKVETVPAGIKYSRLLELTGGALHISGGWAVMQMPEALRRGVHAFMPTGMHWIYTRIFDEFQNGNVQKSIDLFDSILPVLAFSNQHLDISIHFFKRLLWKQGIYPTPQVRQPILDFDQVHIETADRLIAMIMDIEEKIKSGF